MIRGGFNVYPREIEEVLYAHEAIVEAAVVGRPDPRLGEEVVAYVSLAPGAAATPDEIIAYAKERLAAYKYPREVHVLAELPKGSTGKILKSELRGPLRSRRPPPHASRQGPGGEGFDHGTDERDRRRLLLRGGRRTPRCTSAPSPSSKARRPPTATSSGCC